MKLTNLQTAKPEITAKGIAIALLAWVMYTLLSTALLASSEQVPILGAAYGMGLSNALMGVLMIPSWYLIVRGLYHKSGWIKAGAHIAVGLAFTIIWYFSYLALFDWVFGRELLGDQFIDNRGWIMFSTFIIYLIAFAIIHTIESSKRLRVKKQQAAELKEASRQQEIATLKAQLNPHFLFNTLNSINATVTKDPEQTREMIAKLSDMLRYSLDSFEKEEVSLSDELNFVKTYLSLEKRRLGERLNVELAIDDDTKNIPIPPMIVQPLVENAVKHGIAPKEEGGTISLQIRQQNQRLLFRIEDTGQGMADLNIHKNQGGIGLKNTHEMLTNRFGKQAGLKIEHNQPQGTIVTFSIPLQ